MIYFLFFNHKALLTDDNSSRISIAEGLKNPPFIIFFYLLFFFWDKAKTELRYRYIFQKKPSKIKEAEWLICLGGLNL